MIADIILVFENRGPTMCYSHESWDGTLGKKQSNGETGGDREVVRYAVVHAHTLYIMLSYYVWYMNN